MQTSTHFGETPIVEIKNASFQDYSHTNDRFQTQSSFNLKIRTIYSNTPSQLSISDTFVCRSLHKFNFPSNNPVAIFDVIKKIH